MTRSAYRQKVDSFLRRFGELVGVDYPPLDADGYSAVARGTAQVGINVLEQRGVLLFLAPLLPVPERGREAFYRRLLELNFLATSDGAFAVDRERDLVVLRALRGIDGLTFEEFVDLLETVSELADRWNRQLRPGGGAG